MNEIFLDGRVSVKVGDITCESVDAIVNAANATLLGGGGVDGAIHRAGGPHILAECRSIREEQHPDGLPTGMAVMTTGGDLAAKHVIHTVRPIYGQNGGRDAELLADCCRNSISLAARHGLASIAFPSISTGAFGYPRHLAAPVASTTIREALNADQVISEVRLIFYSADDAGEFLKHLTF